jgi:OHCU decarboxylase
MRFFSSACSSTRWVESMKAAHPFRDGDDVLARADSAFDTLEEQDWREAFAGHPRIGERGDDLANQEQVGAKAASATVLESLARANQAYEERHGFTYIVYATGKTAAEMLAIAEERLANSRQGELANAAREQRAITETRLRRMLCMEDGQ